MILCNIYKVSKMFITFDQRERERERIFSNNQERGIEKTFREREREKKR